MTRPTARGSSAGPSRSTSRIHSRNRSSGDRSRRVHESKSTSTARISCSARPRRPSHRSSSRSTRRPDGSERVVRNWGSRRLSVLCAVLILLAVGVRTEAQQAPPILIKEIAVDGNRRVQEAVILGRVQSKLGGQFNPGLLSEDLRAIFSLGFFDDVQMRVEDLEGGVKVVFVVTERPFVRDVDFTGNKKLSTNTRQEKIDLKLGSVYNPVDVQRAREKLKEYYEEEGY